MDSNDFHASAWVEAAERHGRRLEHERARRLIGMGSDRFVPEAFGVDKASAEGRQLSEAWEEIYRQRYLPRLQATPGAADLLRRMKAEGLKLSVATSAEPSMLEQMLKVAGVAQLIEDSTTSGDTDESKPAPDILQAALDRSGLIPAETVMIGDTPYDLQAARKAGVRLVALRSGGWSDADFEGAAAVYDHPADLLAHYDESPLAVG